MTSQAPRPSTGQSRLTLLRAMWNSPRQDRHGGLEDADRGPAGPGVDQGAPEREQRGQREQERHGVDPAPHRGHAADAAAGPDLKQRGRRREGGDQAGHRERRGVRPVIGPLAAGQQPHRAVSEQQRQPPDGEGAPVVDPQLAPGPLACLPHDGRCLGDVQGGPLSVSALSFMSGSLGRRNFALQSQGCG